MHHFTVKSGLRASAFEVWSSVPRQTQRRENDRASIRGGCASPTMPETCRIPINILPRSANERIITDRHASLPIRGCKLYLTRLSLCPRGQIDRRISYKVSETHEQLTIARCTVILRGLQFLCHITRHSLTCYDTMIIIKKKKEKRKEKRRIEIPVDFLLLM